MTLPAKLQDVPWQHIQILPQQHPHLQDDFNRSNRLGHFLKKKLTYGSQKDNVLCTIG